MKKRLICLLFSLFWLLPTLAHSPSITVKLEHVQVNMRSHEVLLRGAKFYAAHCMSCHTMKYMLHDPIAQEALIAAVKMPIKQQEWIGGVAPPDLTMIAAEYTPDWLYTYLHSFYKDSKQPTGYNNLLVPNINMPNILLPLQGEQVLRHDIKWHHDAVMDHANRYFHLLKLVRPGTMDPAQFNEVTADLVSFLVYAADPHEIQRHNIGIWVLFGLAIFFVLAFLLYRSYWRDKK